uniref:Uncharacterized protein n=1 Tax=Rhizophora mucronata TaxID=61149 RepID=A0A2P2P745_RHIMU
MLVLDTKIFYHHFWCLLLLSEVCFSFVESHCGRKMVKIWESC